MISIRNQHLFAISLTLVVMLVFAYAVSLNLNVGTALAVRPAEGPGTGGSGGGDSDNNCHNTDGEFCYHNSSHWCTEGQSPVQGADTTYYFSNDPAYNPTHGRCASANGQLKLIVHSDFSVSWESMPGFNVTVTELHLKAASAYQSLANPTSPVTPTDTQHWFSHICIDADVSDAEDPEEPIITPSISVRKTAPAALQREAGSSINIPYAVYVTNNSHFQDGYEPTEDEMSNLTVSKVILNDELLGLENLTINELKLFPGDETCVWFGPYNYSGPDGTVTNVVYATAFHSDLWSTEPPGRAEVSTEISSISEPPTPTRSILVEKIAPSALVRPADGSVNIPYSVYVTNTSTVPEDYELTESEAASLIINQVMLKDDLLDMNWTGYDVRIARGERKEITVDPLVYEAHFDGTVTNTVYAKARFGRSILVEGYDDAVTEITSQTPGTLTPGIQVTKTGDPASGLPGTSVTYSCYIYNSGDYTLSNLTLHDVFTVNGAVVDPVIDSALTLAPRTGTTVTFTYTIPADAATGPWPNVVTATGTYYNSRQYPTPISDDDTFTFTVIRPEQPRQPEQPQNPGGGDGPSANYGQQESVSIPSETPVNSPAPPQEALQIPVETPVAAPLAPIAPKGELPFTGGDPVAFGMAGMSLLGVAALVRRWFE
ncbi:MAG: hypothetical protein ACM3UZ_00565 [Acidobacteriota bacterium]